MMVSAQKSGRPSIRSRKMSAKFGQAQIIDVPRLVLQNTEKWVNINLTEVNDCIVRLGILEGEFHWHKHEREDELFFVLEGTLFLDLETGTLELRPQQGYTVPRQVLHRTRAREKTVVLMVEQNTVNPRGD
jgi:mannose-6-phosphate isomerase-like protein (cupin superfamily)